LVTGFIVHVGWEVTSDVVGHLMDSVDPEVITKAESAALSVPGVDHVHVRARWLGRSLLVEVEGFMSSSILLADTEGTGRSVRESVPS
jgi:divalent metal cation (Fe/Co/Zn/Cd) transporter